MNWLALGIALLVSTIALSLLGFTHPWLYMGTWLLCTFGWAWRTGRWSGFVAAMSRKEPATTLALFRIFCGLGLLLTVGVVVQAGLVEMIWLDKKHGGFRNLSGGFWITKWLGGATPGVVWPLVWGCLVSGAMLTLGLGGRITAFVGLQCFLSVNKINGHCGGSYDELLTNCLWLCVLAPTTRTLSLDCRIRTGSWYDLTPVAAWVRYLVVWQLVICYCTTGLQKVSAYWVPGGDWSALYYILQQPTWHRFDMHWAAWIFPLTQVGTAVTWFWEVLAPVWILAMWFRYTHDRPGRIRAWSNRIDLRSWWAAIGILMHVLLLLLMDVGPFTPVTLTLYLCLYHPSEYHALWQRIRQRFNLTTPAQAPTEG